MKSFILILWTCLVVRSDWKDTQTLYWANNVNPMVALTSTVLHGIDHATGGVTGVQIGDQTGILPGLCTGFITAGTCPSQQNCEFCRDHKNVDNDGLQWVTGRPMSVGITYIATNLMVGQPVWWYSSATRAWISSTITITLFAFDQLITFGGGETAWSGLIIIGSTPVAGDSGSPVFTSNGDFIGSVGNPANPSGAVVHYVLPNGSTYRPVGPATPPFSVGTFTEDD